MSTWKTFLQRQCFPPRYQMEAQLIGQAELQPVSTPVQEAQANRIGEHLKPLLGMARTHGDLGLTGGLVHKLAGRTMGISSREISRSIFLFILMIKQTKINTPCFFMKDWWKKITIISVIWNILTRLTIHNSRHLALAVMLQTCFVDNWWINGLMKIKCVSCCILFGNGKAQLGTIWIDLCLVMTNLRMFVWFYLAFSHKHCLLFVYIQLASDAGSLIAMTDDEKKRLEDLLQDVEILAGDPKEVRTWLLFHDELMIVVCYDLNQD